MNKQEAIEKLEYLKRLLEEGSKDSYNHGFINALKYTLNVVEQLKEPEKPVVPKYVADMIVERKKQKYGIVETIQNLGVFNNPFNWIVENQLNWIIKNQEDFVKAWLYGYEIEKEKLYFVEIPNPNSEDIYDYFLKKDSSTGKVVLFKKSVNPLNNKDLWLTESEIKKDFEWAWQFAKEVEE